MDELRKAIDDLVAEDIGAVGELTYVTKNLVEAWNALPGVEPITYEEV